MRQKPQCHECMGTDLNMKATATQVQILLKLIFLLMHLFSPLPVLGSPTPSSIPAGNSAHTLIRSTLRFSMQLKKLPPPPHHSKESALLLLFECLSKCHPLSLSPIGAADIVFGLFSPLLPRYSTSAMLKLCGQVA